MFEVNGTVVVRGMVARQAWRSGPWLADTDVLDRGDGEGPFVNLVDESALPLGTGLLGSSPERAIRLVSSARTRDPLLLLRARLERAAARRRSDMLGGDAYRLCHAEADGVVGLFVDRFGEGLLVHADSPETEPLVDPLADALAEITGVRSIAIKPQDGGPRRLLRGDDPRVRFHHGRLVLTADLLNSSRLTEWPQQLENQRYARRWARGRVLELYAGHGGYGLQLADAGARHVVFVEADASDAAGIAHDADRNALTERTTVVNAAPAQHLASLEDGGERFDCVVAHPPLVVEPDDAADEAKRRSYDMYRRIFRLLDEGGLLVTWSGSTALSQIALVDAMVEAAGKNRKRLQVIARLGAGPDHPALLGMRNPHLRPSLVVRVLDMA
jgi:23S rRNA (cytosine1962-C5)-methyltransferase